MKQHLSKLAAGFATITAFLGSCCAFPLLLLSLGIGSMGFAVALNPYRPYFMGATVLLLAVAFYFVYGRKQECEEGKTCDLKSIRRTKILLWIAVALTLIFFFGPDLITQCLLPRKEG